MKTLKTMQAERIVNSCDAVLLDCLNFLAKLENDFATGEIRASKAKREYGKIMQRVTFYNRISFAVCNKYPVGRAYQISDFAEFIHFFEY